MTFDGLGTHLGSPRFVRGGATKVGGRRAGLLTPTGHADLGKADAARWPSAGAEKIARRRIEAKRTLTIHPNDQNARSSAERRERSYGRVACGSWAARPAGRQALRAHPRGRVGRSSCAPAAASTAERASRKRSRTPTARSRMQLGTGCVGSAGARRSTDRARRRGGQVTLWVRSPNRPSRPGTRNRHSSGRGRPAASRGWPAGSTGCGQGG